MGAEEIENPTSARKATIRWVTMCLSILQRVFQGELMFVKGDKIAFEISPGIRVITTKIRS